MYFTANGRALPCCIAPFSQRGYENYTLGDATQQSLREIWTGPAYRDFRKALKSNTPPEACASCGLRWSSVAMPPQPARVAVVIPTFNEAESIAAVVAELPRDIVGRIIVADGGSSDGTQRARAAPAPRSIDAGRGYGRACLAGAQAAEDAEIIVFMDGDGADDPAAIARWSRRSAPARRFRHRLARARRARAGQHGVHQILAGLVAGWLTNCSTACATPTCARSAPSAATPCWRWACAK